MAPSRPVLVTGGAGYIGSRVMQPLRRAGHPVVVYDDRSTGFAWAAGGAGLVVADLAEHEPLRRCSPRAGPVPCCIARPACGSKSRCPTRCSAIGTTPCRRSFCSRWPRAPRWRAWCSRRPPPSTASRASSRPRKPRRPGDPSTLVASNGKLRAVLGWEPRHDDLEFIVGTAWRWERQLQAAGGLEGFGAAPSARIAELGAR